MAFSFKHASCRFCVAAALAVSISACSSPFSPKQTDGANISGGATELSLMFFGDKPEDWDLVVDAFVHQTDSSLHVRLRTEWDSVEDYAKKLMLKLAAGEEMDAVFDASWMSLEKNAAQGYYRNLDSYFGNDAYPGLKAAFPEAFLDANRINGHIYAIPLTQSYHDIEILYIRKDLREEFGMSPIASYDDLRRYFQLVQEKKPEMIPLALKGDRGFFRMFDRSGKMLHYRAAPDAIAGTGIDFALALSEDGKQVLGATTYGDPASYYESLPAPMNNPDDLYASLDSYVKWNAYVQRDVLNERNAAVLFESGKSAAYEGTLSGWNAVRQDLKQSIPGAELEGFAYKTCQREMQAGCIGTDYRAWNNLAIPVTSKHTELVMRFVDWIFQSQEHHDLFELGIEGVHWKSEPDRLFKRLPASSRYVFPAFLLTWNPTLSRIDADSDPEALKLLQYASKASSYYQLPLAGFAFNPLPVKSEIARIQPVATQMLQVFKSGLDPAWRATAAQTNQRLREMGLDRIREELIRQAQSYLDDGGV